MFSAADLSDTSGRAWREAEETAFTVLSHLCCGDVPDLDGADDAALRRVGYLAEVALLLLDPADPERLEHLIHDVEGRMGGRRTQPVLSAIPNGRPAVCGTDDLAAAWGMAPGISVARFRAEAPAILAVSSPALSKTSPEVSP